MEALELLVAACEREYLCDDEPDDSDVSIPPCGITMGMIRAARREIGVLKAGDVDKAKRMADAQERVAEIFPGTTL